MGTMIEAEVDEQGNIRPKQPVDLPPGSRLLITVVELGATETARLSEAALGADWNRPEEDGAWSDLGQGLVVVLRFPFSDLSSSKVPTRCRSRPRCRRRLGALPGHEQSLRRPWSHPLDAASFATGGL
jgi:predicted DNA-binding antitoxin AbrB/MazE fold protein